MGSAEASERLWNASLELVLVIIILFIVHLWNASLDVNLFELLVKWKMLVERDFMLGESGG